MTVPRERDETDAQVVRDFITGAYYESPDGPLYQYEEGPDAPGAGSVAFNALDRILAANTRLREALERIAAMEAMEQRPGAEPPFAILFAHARDIGRQALDRETE